MNDGLANIDDDDDDDDYDDYVLVRRADFDNLAAAIYDTPVDDHYLANLDLAARRLVKVKPAIAPGPNDR